MKTFKGLTLEPETAFRQIAAMIEAGLIFQAIDMKDKSDTGEFILHQAQLYSKAAHNHVLESRGAATTAEHANSCGMTIGDRIQLARENLGMSHDDLAEKLDIHPGDVLAWEDGDDQPLAGMVIPLVNALKCDPMWLLTGESSNHQSPATPVHQSRNQYSGQQRSAASDHASHHVKHQSQA
ncbi:helix-turn-helix domain-containing protein [Salmonella enterica]|nr:helix-turn-helix domain-containing protein [Salmonella enterica]